MPAAGARFSAAFATDAGAFVVELDTTTAPVTVVRFMELARAGVFDDLPVSRVVPGVLVSAGELGADGEPKLLRHEDSRHPLVRGSVAMADAGRDTATTRFFITLRDQPQLQSRFTVFGRVIQGLDILDLLHPGDRIKTVKIRAGAAPPAAEPNRP